MITLVIPTFGGHPENIERTINSVDGICDEVVIISTAFWLEDQRQISLLSPKVRQLDWNHTFITGFGDMMNQGTHLAKNDWLMLLGVAETFAEPLRDVHEALRRAPSESVFRCNHVNDENTWGRVWNRRGGTAWGGVIHEEIGGGVNSGLLFRMQDTEKTPCEDPIKNEAMRFMKTCLYNYCYRRLLEHPDELSFTDRGWLKFVAGARESIYAFCEAHKEMLESFKSSSPIDFLRLVEDSVNRGNVAAGVNYAPQGEPKT